MSDAIDYPEFLAMKERAESADRGRELWVEAYRLKQAECDRLRDHFGDCLMRVRLALTAHDLIADGMSDDVEEPMRILIALVRDLVAAGVVDPMESAVGGDSQ